MTAAVPPAVVEAASAWARQHGCRDIASCNQTSLAAFAAGMAAERERIRQLAQQRTGQALADILIVTTTPEGPPDARS